MLEKRVALAVADLVALAVADLAVAMMSSHAAGLHSKHPSHAAAEEELAADLREAFPPDALAIHL